MTARISTFATAICLTASLALAQAAGPSQLKVTVVDQTGGVVPQATVTVTAEGAPPVTATADDNGIATIPDLPAATIQLHVEFSGFLPVDRAVSLRRGANNQSVTLSIGGLQEQVVVTDTSATDDRRGNSMTTELTEADIQGLSDDPDELQEQLEALAGGEGAVFQVNGFRGGRLPNKNEIQRIRFRTNSFAAENHDAGRVQVEIITRPGASAWSGNANMGFRSDVLDARNAFANEQTPEQFRRYTMGLRGPLVKGKTSLRINVDGNNSYDSGTIFALTPGGTVLGDVRRPYDQTNVTVGLDHGFTRNTTLRLEYRNSQNERHNLGVGDTNLMERAYSTDNTERQLRTSLQTVIGKNSLNELRLQLNDSDAIQQSTTDGVAIIVLDNFSTGGAGVASNGRMKTLQLGDDLDFTMRKHAMRAGLLLEVGHYHNFDTRNAAGTFTFGSLESYNAGLPQTFTQRLGEVNTAFTQYQLGMYYQDDFRLNKQLSMSLGVRQEMQNHVDSTLNLMPRLGFTWNILGSKTLMRGGYGIFHDWYDESLYDQTLRVNGTSQRDLLILNPGYPDPFAKATADVLPGGRVQNAAQLELPFIQQASVGIERAFGQKANLQVSYLRLRGSNQLRSVNINAPDANGVRPEPGIGTVTQIESTGRSASDSLRVNFNYRVPAQRILINANYTLGSVRNMADSALSLPANSLDPDAEWGPAAQDIRHRVSALVNFPLWAGVRANIIGNASSAPPYTIITGHDDNGDGVVNDRPLGIGRNSARGAARIELNTRFTRTFGFGGVRGGTGAIGRDGGGGGAIVAQGAGGPPPGVGQQVFGPGGGPGGGGGRGGGPGAAVDQRFSVEFYLQAFNLLNRVNYVNFSGNEQSALFGLPTSAAPARRLEVGMQFRF